MLGRNIDFSAMDMEGGVRIGAPVHGFAAIPQAENHIKAGKSQWETSPVHHFKWYFVYGVAAKSFKYNRTKMKGPKPLTIVIKLGRLQLSLGGGLCVLTRL